MELFIGQIVLISLSVLVLGIGSEPSSNGSRTDNRTLEEEIEIQLRSRRAKKFLRGLSNSFQREIVLTNLRQCPFVPLCRFELNFDPLKYNLLREFTCCFPCSCDKEKCLSARNCCPDILWSRQNTLDLSDGVREICVAKGINGVHTNSVHFIKAISECPSQTDSDLVTKCVRSYETNLGDLEIEDITLVSDTSSDRIYRNKYCAECNFMNSSSRLYWQPRLECDLNQKISIMTSSIEFIKQIVNGEIHCNVIFEQPKINASIQICNSISDCNFTGLWDSHDPYLERACRLYESVIRVIRGQSFRNVFCARCNGFYPTPTDICYTYIHDGGNIPTHFAGFLRLSDSIQDNTNSCGKDEKYDSIKDKCRQMVCSEGRELKNGRCELIFDGKVTMSLDINLRLDPQDPIPLQLAYDIVPTVKCLVTDEISKRVDSYFLASNTQILLQTNSLGSKNINGSRLSVKWGEVASQTTDSKILFYLLRVHIYFEAQLEKTVDSLRRLSGVSVSLNGTEFAKLYLKKPLPIFVMKLLHDTNKWKFDTITNGVFPKNIRTGVFDMNEGDLPLLFNDANNMLQITYPHWNDYTTFEPRYALLSLKSCPMFKIAWEEFNWKESVNSIEMEGTSIRLDAENYTIVRESKSTYLLICVDVYFEKFKLLDRFANHIDSNPLSITKVVISIIFVCVSIICLIFSFVTYCMFEQLRTLPGKNNIALIVSLSLAQICYLIGGTANLDRNGLICKIIGVLTHIFWLVSMFWMNICTFHMCQVLLKIKNMSHSSNCRRYVYYHLYCISMTLICVFVNVGVSMATSENTDFGYGKIICYVSTQKMVDFTFGVPSVLVVISNFSMFLAIIISLKRRPSIRQNVKNDRNYFVVFIKLSTVTGITWIFGFLYMWTGKEAFSFLFIILNASQGLFIMLAFVCNKRTINLYKELLRRHDRSLPSTGINPADTTADTVSTHLKA